MLICQSPACPTCFDPGSSSDCDEMSPSDDDESDGIDIPACTPLAAFLSFKQDAEKRRATQVPLEATGKVPKLCCAVTERQDPHCNSTWRACVPLLSCQNPPWWPWCPTCWLFWSSTPISSSCSSRPTSTESSWRGTASSTAARWRRCGRPTASASKTRTASSAAWRRPSARPRVPWATVRSRQGGGEEIPSGGRGLCPCVLSMKERKH